MRTVLRSRKKVCIMQVCDLFRANDRLKNKRFCKL